MVWVLVVLLLAACVICCFALAAAAGNRERITQEIERRYTNSQQ